MLSIIRKKSMLLFLLISLTLLTSFYIKYSLTKAGYEYSQYLYLTDMDPLPLPSYPGVDIDYSSPQINNTV